MDQGKSISAAIDVFDKKLDEIERELNGLVLEVPNLTAPDVPVAASLLCRPGPRIVDRITRDATARK